MTVAELSKRISSAEITEWIALARIEPFGEERADLRAALIACTIANAHRGKNQKPFKISDFLLNFDRPKQQTAAEMKAILVGLPGTTHGND